MRVFLFLDQLINLSIDGVLPPPHLRLGGEIFNVYLFLFFKDYYVY